MCLRNTDIASEPNRVSVNLSSAVNKSGRTASARLVSSIVAPVIDLEQSITRLRLSAFRGNELGSFRIDNA